MQSSNKTLEELKDLRKGTYNFMRDGSNKTLEELKEGRNGSELEVQ